MSTELATNWTPAEKIPPAKPHALALFPVNDTERAEQFVKLFADEFGYVHARKRWLLWGIGCGGRFT